MSMKKSVLRPLGQKTSPRAARTGVYGSNNVKPISSTPSPIATPVATQSLSSIGVSGVPSLSPAPSPAPISSSLATASILPAVTVPSTPSPSFQPASPLRLSPQTSPSLPLSSLSSSIPPPSPLSSPSFTRSIPPPSPLSSPSFTRSSPLSLPAIRQSPIPPPSSSPLTSSPIPPVSSSPSFRPMESPIDRLERTLSEPVPSLGELARYETPDSPIDKLERTLSETSEGSSSPIDKLERTLSESSLSFETQEGPVEDDSVERTLTRAGYVPVDQVLTKDDNDMMMCQYIKAVDETGRTTFVDMDCEGYVSVDANSKPMVATNEASVVPYSVKMGTFECADSDVCGVAFECEGEVCTLKREGDSLEPTESVFTQSHQPGSEGHSHHGMLKNHPIAYPIVSLTDIMNNPEQVACSIRDSHNRMRNIGFSQCQRDSQDLSTSVDRLNKEIRRYISKQKEVSEALSRTIAQLEAAHAQTKGQAPQSPEAAAVFRSVKYNLRRRNDMVVDHLKLCESVNSRMDKVNELTSEIRALNDFADQLFEGLENAYVE